MAERSHITVKGIVQGVGFRPYVFGLAAALNLRGYITNTADGVSIEVEGDRVGEFVDLLPQQAPPLSRITDLAVSSLPVLGYTSFRILESADEGGIQPFTLISPDVSVCDDCMRELMDPADRRYLYPFINCTNCGPRYSITLSVPYDRPNTTMAPFAMCAACSAEYRNPADRRFHAQPNACNECGPQVTLACGEGPTLVGRGAMEEAIELLRSGRIVAIKGLGGFHLACDATNASAVSLLRQRKRKSNKPFALMAPSVPLIERYCFVGREERLLLLSSRRPVVLLKKRALPQSALPEAVSPGNAYLGFMLPYTPLHSLLFSLPPGGSLARGEPNFDSLVMTSGNLAEEPLVKDNGEARTVLAGMADAVLMHDREIFMRVDDSVVRICEEAATAGSLQFIRRSRGYAPDPIRLSADGPEVLGCGADLKNTFTITKGAFAIPSQHIGDMENYETLSFYEECLENLQSTYRCRPVALGHDLHPGYLSTRWALARKGIEKHALQHHYAHTASVMAEHGLAGKVIGIAFDGTGYGTDGTLWGSEFLLADVAGFERLGHFGYVNLPGGETAIREPWRTAVSYVCRAFGPEAMDLLRKVGFGGRFGDEQLARVVALSGAEEISPRACGAGRLFDAVSALVGICDRNTFEGESAMALEAALDEGFNGTYPCSIGASLPYVVDFNGTIGAIVCDILAGVAPGRISAGFHNTVADAILQVVMAIGRQYGVRDVALSGGTFQNTYLRRRCIRHLTEAGFAVYLNTVVPCNDACISLGQAFLVRERVKAGIAPSPAGE